MNKKTYWKSLSVDQKSNLATIINTSTGYLRQVFLYDRPTGASRARSLAALTGLGAHEFCPDAFDAHDALNIQHEPRMAV